MVHDFPSILKELESYFKCPLASDRLDACLVEMPSGLKIQMSFDKTKEHFCIAARLGEIPLYGNYRELLFKTALIANGITSLNEGVVAFSSKSNNLILFLKLPLIGLSGHKIIPQLDRFIANANKWVTALKHSELPSIDTKEDLQSIFS